MKTTTVYRESRQDNRTPQSPGRAFAIPDIDSEHLAARILAARFALPMHLAELIASLAGLGARQ